MILMILCKLALLDPSVPSDLVWRLTVVSTSLVRRVINNDENSNEMFERIRITAIWMSPRRFNKPPQMSPIKQVVVLRKLCCCFLM